MSLSDCSKCWETPCCCGHGYRDWPEARILGLIDALISVLQNREPTAPVKGHDESCKHENRRKVELPGQPLVLLAFTVELCPDCGTQWLLDLDGTVYCSWPAPDSEARGDL